MSLTEAAAVLGMAANGVRSRFKAGEIFQAKGDNAGKLWVFLDPDATEGSQRPRSKVAAEGVQNGETGDSAALRAEVAGLRAQLVLMREQLDDVKGQFGDVKEERDTWRRQAVLLAEQRRGLFGFRARPVEPTHRRRHYGRGRFADSRGLPELRHQKAPRKRGLHRSALKPRNEYQLFGDT